MPLLPPNTLRQNRYGTLPRYIGRNETVSVQYIIKYITWIYNWFMPFKIVLSYTTKKLSHYKSGIVSKSASKSISSDLKSESIIHQNMIYTHIYIYIWNNKILFCYGFTLPMNFPKRRKQPVCECVANVHCPWLVYSVLHTVLFLKR